MRKQCCRFSLLLLLPLEQLEVVIGIRLAERPEDAHGAGAGLVIEAHPATLSVAGDVKQT